MQGHKKKFHLLMATRSFSFGLQYDIDDTT